MQPSVTKSGAACGAEIAFDLAGDLDDATFGAIESAFHDNIVVVFRDQLLSNERHIEFSRRFGELEIYIVKRFLLPGFPEILLISNVRNQAGLHIGLADAGFTWHTDTSYRRRPSRCSLQKRCRTATAARSAIPFSPIRWPPIRRCRNA